MNNIPKIAHFYWGAPMMPYLRYVTLYSFKKCNPDWTVKLHIPKNLVLEKSWKDPWNKSKITGVDYFEKCYDISEVNIVDMESFGYSNNLSEVIKSDLFRLYILYTDGGLWSDTDIVYFKPIEKGITEVEFTAAFCYHGYHSIGFLMGAPDNYYFKTLFEESNISLNINRYESVGKDLYMKHIHVNSPGIYNIPMEVVYPQNYVFADSFFTTTAQSHIQYIKGNTIGWHWYAGNPICGEQQNIYNENNFRNFDNIISYLLGEFYDRYSN